MQNDKKQSRPAKDVKVTGHEKRQKKSSHQPPAVCSSPVCYANEQEAMRPEFRNE